MTAFIRHTGLLAVAASLMLTGCDRLHGPGAKAPFDTAALESAIDGSFGGVGTCVIVADVPTGAEVYRYGAHSLCERPLPPCETFEVASLLTALDRGAVAPTTVLKYDGRPQRVSAWRRDFDTPAAFKEAVEWWDQRVARQVGPRALADSLKVLNYGNAKTGGPADGFWLGPSVGGQLGISTAQQAQFMARLAGGRLKVKPQSAAYVQSLMIGEARGQAVLSDKSGSCASQPDLSRHVTWWVGRLKTPQHDYAFAVSLEGSSEDALPGSELRERGGRAFAAAGMWPAAA